MRWPWGKTTHLPPFVTRNTTPMQPYQRMLAYSFKRAELMRMQHNMGAADPRCISRRDGTRVFLAMPGRPNRTRTD